MFKGKRMKKRKVALAIFVAGILCLGGCSTKQPDLKAKGMEMIALMEEKASNEKFVEIYSGGVDLEEVIDGLAEGNYTSPEKVYVIKLPPDGYLEQMDEDLSGMSETLKTEIYKKISSGLASTLNGKEGAMSLAATSVLTGTTAFEGKLETSVIYLYQFADRGNSVMVSYVPAQDNVITASCVFLTNEEIKSLESEEEILNWLSLNLGGLEGIEVTTLD